MRYIIELSSSKESPVDVSRGRGWFSEEEAKDLVGRLALVGGTVSMRPVPCNENQRIQWFSHDWTMTELRQLVADEDPKTLEVK